MCFCLGFSFEVTFKLVDLRSCTAVIADFFDGNNNNIFFSTASGLINSVTPSSPKIGNRSIAFLNVTAKDANGEIGFSTAHQSVSVQEPAGPSSLFMQLAVRRTGTADRVVVYWNITSVSATFYANDTGPQSGEVAFEKGIFACSYLK